VGIADTFSAMGRSASRRCAINVIAAMVVCLISVARSSSQDRGYIYEASTKGNNLAIVIDTNTRYVGIQDKRNVRIGSMDNEFAGFYEDCSNDAFHCLTGPLEIVIPKVMPVQHWAYHGLWCHSVLQPGGDAYRIICRSDEHGATPTYMYSVSRGVVSIESSPIGSIDRFELRGKQGLFSPGNNP
jgi:hypothetical protein